MSFPSIQATDVAYPMTAREAFILADLRLRGRLSQFSSEFAGEEPSLDFMWRVVQEMQAVSPFFPPESSSTSGRPLTPADKFRYRQPVWRIIDELANRLFSDQRGGLEGSSLVNAEQILSLIRDYQKSERFQKFLESWLEDAAAFGVKSLKFFDGDGQELPLAERYGKTSNQLLLNFVAITAERLDAHFKKTAEKPA